MGESHKPGIVPPPPYTTANGSQDGATVSPTPQYPIPSNVNQTNFVKVCRSGNVKGIWAIDPIKDIPENMLAALRPLEIRKNIALESDNGNMEVDIFVVPSLPNQVKKKATIGLISSQGWISLRVHDVERQNVSDTRLPIDICCDAPDSSAYIYIPRSFRGPLRLTTAKSSQVTYTKAVRGQLTPISEVDGVHRSFIGQFNASEWDGTGRSWKGDELEVNCRGSINIYFDDEGTIPKTESEEGCVCV